MVKGTNKNDIQILDTAIFLTTTINRKYYVHTIFTTKYITQTHHHLPVLPPWWRGFQFVFSVLSKSWVTRSGSTLLLSHGVASWCIVVPTHNRQKVKLEEVVSFSPQMIKSFLPCAGGGGATASGSSPVFSFPSLVDMSGMNSLQLLPLLLLFTLLCFVTIC